MVEHCASPVDMVVQVFEVLFAEFPLNEGHTFTRANELKGLNGSLLFNRLEADLKWPELTESFRVVIVVDTL